MCSNIRHIRSLSRSGLRSLSIRLFSMSFLLTQGLAAERPHCGNVDTTFYFALRINSNDDCIETQDSRYRDIWAFDSTVVGGSIIFLCLISSRVACFYSSAYEKLLRPSRDIILICRIWRFLIFVIHFVTFHAPLQKKSATPQRIDILFRLTTIDRFKIHLLKEGLALTARLYTVSTSVIVVSFSLPLTAVAIWCKAL